jgi:hypothetical protein
VLLAGAAAAVLGRPLAQAFAATGTSARLPAPGHSGLDHVIVEHIRPRRPSDDLRPPRGERSSGRVLLRHVRLPPALPALPGDHASVQPLLRAMQVGTAASLLVHRPEFHVPRQRAALRERRERRPPARRHSRRRVLPVHHLRRSHEEPGLDPHAARDHLRRMGRLLRPRSATRRVGRAARLPSSLPIDLAVRAPGSRRARRVRPHLDPQAGRVAMGARAADRARRGGRQSRLGARLIALRASDTGDPSSPCDRGCALPVTPLRPGAGSRRVPPRRAAASRPRASCSRRGRGGTGRDRLTRPRARRT